MKYTGKSGLIATLVFHALFLHAEANPVPEPVQSTELEPIEVSSDRLRSDGDAVPQPGEQRVPITSDVPGPVSRQLIRAPSISTRKWGTDEAAELLSLRGQDPAQTRLHVNGFPLGDAGSSGLDSRWLRSNWISHAAVYPNGDPLALRQESLGGAVDLRTDFGEEPSPKHYDVGVHAGSFGARGANARIRQRGFGIGADARLAEDNFAFQDSAGTIWDSSDDSEARRSGNRWRRGSILPWATVSFGQLDLKAFWLGGWEDRQLPGPAGSIGTLQWKEQLHLAGVTARHRASGSWIKSYGRYRDNGVDNPNGARSFGSAGVPSRSREVAGGVAAGTAQNLSTRWRLREVLGADVERLENEVILAGGRKLKSMRRWASAGLAVDARYVVDTSLVVPVEVDWYEPFEGTVGYPAQPKQKYVLFSPRLTTRTRVLPGLILHTVVGYIEKGPALYDLYGDSRGLLPNPTLIPERAVKLEAGVEVPARFGSIQVVTSFTSALSENRDLIARVSTGPSTSMAQNIGRSRVLSQEMSTIVTSVSGWKAHLVGQWLMTTNRSPVVYYDAKELPFRPRLRWALDLEKSWNRFSVGYLWQWQSAFYADQLNSTIVEPFHEHSLRARYIGSAFGDWTLDLGNLFDATTVGGQVVGQAFRIAPSGIAGYPYPGRRVYLTWNYPW